MDYAIARRIVDLHSRQEESVDRVFSVDDIQRYITFARQFKPKVGQGLFSWFHYYPIFVMVKVVHV